LDSRVLSVISSEAALGMLGRTGAPQKGPLQKHNFFHFLQHGNKPEMLK